MPTTYEQLEKENKLLRAELLAKRNAPVEDERKAFEAWYMDEYDGGFPTRAITGDGYGNIKTNDLWKAWQARASLPAEQDAELLETIKYVVANSYLDGTGDGVYCLPNHAMEKLEEAIANRKDGV
jgi:hypothetical protein